MLQRTREMGSASPSAPTRATFPTLVNGDGLRLTAVGVVTGVLIALALSRIVAHLLFDVSATDPIVLAGVAMTLASAAALACYLPARRVSRIDPVVTLRYE